MSVGRNGDDPARERIAAAIVEVAGTRGLDPTEVAAVCAQARVSEEQFGSRFDSLATCAIDIHEEMIEALCARIQVATAGRGSWHDRVWAAGLVVMRYLQEDPVRARFLFVCVEDPPATLRARRNWIVQRIADVLDHCSGDACGSHRPSRCTAEIAAGSAYTAVHAKLGAGALEGGEEFLPELVYLVVMPYLGARVAEDDLLVQPLFQSPVRL